MVWGGVSVLFFWAYFVSSVGLVIVMVFLFCCGWNPLTQDQGAK